MEAHDAVAIVFDYPGRPDQIVPIDEAFSFADQEFGTLWTASKVIWRDGTHSYAKNWWDSLTGEMTVIGAGAYGNMDILRRAASR